MSIFRRDPEPQPEPTPAPPAAPRQPRSGAEPPRSSAPEGGTKATHIASGTKVVGQISGKTELVIDGRVEGEIDLESRLVVGASGEVKGEVQAHAVQVGGRVEGNVRGLERVEVQASGGLEGDVVSPRVVIAEGAFFKGKVEMVDQKHAAAKGGAKPAPKSEAQAGGTGGKPGPRPDGADARKGPPAAGAAPGPAGAPSKRPPAAVPGSGGRP